MKVRELISKLADFPTDAEVVRDRFDYDDPIHNPPVNMQIEELKLIDGKVVIEFCEM